MEQSTLSNMNKNVTNIERRIGDHARIAQVDRGGQDITFYVCKSGGRETSKETGRV